MTFTVVHLHPVIHQYKRVNKTVTRLNGVPTIHCFKSASLKLPAKYCMSSCKAWHVCLQFEWRYNFHTHVYVLRYHYSCWVSLIPFIHPYTKPTVACTRARDLSSDSHETHLATDECFAFGRAACYMVSWHLAAAEWRARAQCLSFIHQQVDHLRCLIVHWVRPGSQ